jgi:hypothetical protein
VGQRSSGGTGDDGPPGDVAGGRQHQLLGLPRREPACRPDAPARRPGHQTPVSAPAGGGAVTVRLHGPVPDRF